MDENEKKRKLDELFRKLSSGEISRREFEEASGRVWWWGDILEGLEKRIPAFLWKSCYRHSY